jgi:hypothetical protein
MRWIVRYFSWKVSYSFFISYNFEINETFTFDYFFPKVLLLFFKYFILIYKIRKIDLIEKTSGNPKLQISIDKILHLSTSIKP